MPTYEYRCRACDEHFSRTEKISEHGHDRVTCPKCQSADVERLISAAYPRTARKS
jgi:putative FmdB family regulatory protein